MNKKTIEKILKETEIGYDMMSQKFSQTRKFFWRGMEFIKDYVKDGDRVLDFGCGNGRLLELFLDKSSTNFGSAEAKNTIGANPKLVLDKKIKYTGVDVSQKLLDLAKNKYSQEFSSFLKIDPSQQSLPFEDDFFNSVYSIAVFHHFPKEHAQIMAKELYRVTRPGGQVVVSVWNLWPASTRGDRSSTRGGQKQYFKNILKNWLEKIIGKSELTWNDCYISFKNNQGEIFQRYHHAFTKGEFASLFIKAGFKTEKGAPANNKNIVFIGRK
jgi:ubiquinone/menaquinone biosynthesis C-methylase UbiE